MQLPSSLLRLWPKLGPAFRVILERGGSRGIVFVSADHQAWEACHVVAASLGPTVVEYGESRITKSDFRRRVYNLVLGKGPHPSLFQKPPKRLTVIIKNLDKHGEWFCLRLKYLFEHAHMPFVLLATVNNPERLPDYLQGHYYLCRKRGRPKGI